jgi:hypothetical protein
MRKLDCAQIVPIKVKYFQTVPNETKSVFTAGQQSLSFRMKQNFVPFLSPFVPTKNEKPRQYAPYAPYAQNR